MYIYRHHTASDVIDLDPKTGRWSPVDDNVRPRVGALAVEFRDDYPIRGSYTIEDGKRYCMYWTPDKQFEFLAPDLTTIPIARRQADGATVLQAAPRQCVCAASPSSTRSRQKGLCRV